MAETNKYVYPHPIVDLKEENSLNILTERYNKMMEPGKIAKIGARIVDALPDQLKVVGKDIKGAITAQELYVKALEVIGDGFNTVQELAAKYTISESAIISQVNQITADNEISSISEICLARSYDIAKLVSKQKDQNKLAALVEGGTTGAFGFAGLPFNLVLSTLMYYRAVKSIALFYGYDCKNDASELMIASNVFISAFSPEQNDLNEITAVIGKIMMYAEGAAIRQAAQKGWAEVAARGGAGLLLAQMRALAHKSAQKALQKAGQKGLEKSVFKSIFEQIGKKLSLSVIGKSVYVAGAIVGALFDTAQMKKVLEYADVFYNKRFVMEKEMRINELLGNVDDSIIDTVVVDTKKDICSEEKV